MKGIHDETLKWLVHTPASDLNFKLQLASANEETINAALTAVDGRDGEKVKTGALRRQLRKLIGDKLDATKATKSRQDMGVAMEMAPLEEERERQKQKDAEQANRELLIAQAHEVIGRVQANTLMSKFANVSNLVHLKNIKEAKIYRDLPMVGTWDKYCQYIGLSRQKVDEDLANLAAFGEDFLLTCQQFSLGYRDLRKLRQLTHQGDITIDAETITINDKVIPITEDNADEIQGAIEWILDEKKAITDRVEKLEKDFSGAVKEETKGLQSEKKAFLARIKELEKFEPKEIDDTAFEEQYTAIHGTVATLATQIGKLVMVDGLHENPLLAAKVEGLIASAERLTEELRRDWTAKFQIF
jgi:hypothetical protein